MQISTNEAKEIVLGFVEALNDESFQVARRYLDDDLKHVGPFGSRDGGEGLRPGHGHVNRAPW